MGDRKIIRVDFGARRREPAPTEEVESAAELPEPERLPVTPPVRQSGRGERLRPGVVPPEEQFNFEQIIATLHGLAALRQASGTARRVENVMARHGAAQMGEWSEGELFRAINLGNERDWAARPSYYDAVIEEMKRRGLLPTR